MTMIEIRVSMDQSDASLSTARLRGKTLVVDFSKSINEKVLFEDVILNYNLFLNKLLFK